MGKKTKKFLIICGIVVGAGLLLAVIGAAAGGLDDATKLADHYTWISGPSEDEEQQLLDSSQTFDSVKVSGDLDLDIVKGNEDSVKLIYPKDSGTYNMDVENGTLVVNYDYQKKAIIQLSAEDSTPRLVITQKDPASIKNIDADLSWGDVDLEDLTAETVTLTLDDGDADLTRTQIGTLKVDMDYGDLETESITCGTVAAQLDDGDCDLDGTFNGGINVNADVDAEAGGKPALATNYGDGEDGGTLPGAYGSAAQRNVQRSIKDRKKTAADLNDRRTLFCVVKSPPRRPVRYQWRASFCTHTAVSIDRVSALLRQIPGKRNGRKVPAPAYRNPEDINGCCFCSLSVRMIVEHSRSYP